MTLLDPKIWSGSVYGDGWTEAAGGDAAVTEPATGAELARIGNAAPADIAAAATRAAAAQRDWAAASFEERAAVLRRAGALFEQNTADIADWIVREAGSVPAKAQFEVGLA